MNVFYILFSILYNHENFQVSNVIRTAVSLLLELSSSGATVHWPSQEPYICAHAFFSVRLPTSPSRMSP